MENEINFYDCPVAADCWDGEMTQNPADEQWYCSRHTTKCAKKGCEKKFFDYEFGPDFNCGSYCDNCPWDERDFWCDEHAPVCQLCEGGYHMCEKCTLNNTDDRYTSLCEECFEKFDDDPCSFVCIKGAD